jgi:very-short-patch-repair endonuclease/archaellum component FlaC
MSTNKQNALQTLENLRKRLLDLTARNRLINYRYTKNASLRVIDELPDQLVETLLSDVLMRFASIPEPTEQDLLDAGYVEYDKQTGDLINLKKSPTAEEWAKHLNFATSYEVPEPSTECEAKHADDAIQTLLYPYEMESKLKSLNLTSESAIQEMGANILYFAFGFLEWHDSGHENARIAPLFLVPVRLKKGSLNKTTNTYEYTVEYSGEDIIANLSLREKLREDFGLALPDLDEETTPEHYFKLVKYLIETNKPTWRVRRYVSLALLNFSKLLMYLDLDPNRWPEENNISDHSLVAGFLEGYDDGPNHEDDSAGDFGFGEEYPIDEVDDIHSKYPIIYDADSSQHSALIDAINGKNLVIEGPPGTGKSQTITNLIAAAISQGKKVLFVAEKLAALEVVRRRLDAAGLGDFCLELHSHKSQKRKVLDEIDHRLKKQRQFRKPREIEADIDRYEDLKEKLMVYAGTISQEWKGTGMSIHAILMAATRYRISINPSPNKFHPQGCNGENFDASTRRRYLDQVHAYRDIYIAVEQQLDDGQHMATHPWCGVCNTQIQVFDQERVNAMLIAWSDSAKNLLEEAQAYAKTVNCRDDLLTSIHEIQVQTDFLKSIPKPSGDELLDILPDLRGDLLKKASEYLSLQEEARNLQKELKQYDFSKVISQCHSPDSLNTIKDKITRLVADDLPFSELSDIRKKLKDTMGDLEELDQTFNGVAMTVENISKVEISMSESGLHEFKALVNLVSGLDPMLWSKRDDIFDNDELDQIVPRLKTELIAINSLQKEIEGTISTDTSLPASEIRKMATALADKSILRWFKSEWRRFRKMLLSLSEDPNTKFITLLAKVSSLSKLADQTEKLCQDETYAKTLGKNFKGKETDIKSIESLRAWYKSIREHYGFGFGDRATLGDGLLKLDPGLGRSIRSLKDSNEAARVDPILANMNIFRSVFSKVADLDDDQINLSGSEGVINRIMNEINSGVSVTESAFTGKSVSVGEVAQLLEKQISLLRLIGNLTDNDYDNSIFQGKLCIPAGQIEDTDKGFSILRNTLFMANFFDAHSDQIASKLMYDEPSTDTLNKLIEYAASLQTALSNKKASREAYVGLTHLDNNAWQARCDETLTSLIERNQVALDNGLYLQSWLDYIRAREQIENMGLGSLATAVEQSEIVISQIDEAHQAGVYDLLSREILTENPVISTFSGNSHETTQKKFVEYDEKLMKLQCEQIAWKADKNKVPTGVNAARVGDKTEKSLLEWECNKQKRHIPIRQLVYRAGNALSSLKPCFMMGPMSVAQYLKPGDIHFDLVVMDEASQIKPQDALGAIARGSQLVVVGDPKQLPPTNFFDRAQDEEEEDPSGIEISESILDATLPIFKPARRLRWHYRSQHESLIAFSNHFFYDNDLVIFPSPYKKMDGYGIRYSRLHNGTFVNQRNVEEARVISEAVREHFKSGSKDTLGVVAMNAQQRLTISAAIETLAKEDTLFQRLLEEDSTVHESLFIKNLENVQGDERDVIYISMTYGPQEPKGKVYQRFGPINADVGWRRLNVLFTRSKKKMHVFSSMSSDDIVIGPGSKRGVSALKDFLAYCETGILHKTEVYGDRPPDSDFEIAVMAALKNEGYECVPQVGVAGFFIDLAVVDPGNPGRYLMGIECDGATYHSAKSARDRDRLRQSILERLGWRIRRIWSTDWFKNPQAELNPIIKELRKLCSVKREPIKHADNTRIQQAIQEAEQSQSELELYVAKDGNLRNRLSQYNEDVIRKKHPGTIDKERLLRPAMLDALAEFTPTNKTEFLELIPSYLRSGTDGDEAEFLDQVLEIINASLE